MAILTDDDPSKSPEAPLETSAAAEEAAAIAEDAAKDLEKVEKLMGRQHMALYGFIGVFLAVLASAIAYLAGRQGPNPAAMTPVKPPVVITSAAPPAATTTPVLPKTPTVAAVPAAPLPIVAATTPAQTPVPPPVVSAVANKPQTPPVVPATAPAGGALADVLPNRLYLQVGSLDKNVAELLTQGLRLKGVPATVAPGVNETVSRIIVGPFDTASEMGVVDKQLKELGFTPFPRQFLPNELRPTAQNAAVAAGGKAAPVVKR